ncbi:MAG: hypothetical protein PSV35_00605 [bacterium]|nr:hypothetical protein [bacterium]
MNIESLSSANYMTSTHTATDTNIFPEIKKANVLISGSTRTLLDTGTKLTLDTATGLMQSIISDKITNKVIRKLPSSEYLHSLKVVKEIVRGAVNKKI